MKPVSRWHKLARRLYHGNSVSKNMLCALLGRKARFNPPPPNTKITIEQLGLSQEIGPLRLQGAVQPRHPRYLALAKCPR